MSYQDQNYQQNSYQSYSSNQNQMNAPRPRSKSLAREVVLEAALDKVFRHIPSPVGPFLQKMEPVIFSVTRVINHFLPHISLAFNMLINYIQILYVAIQPYEPELLMPMIFGVFMIFFGGSFMLTISAVEAFRICGWDTTRKHLTVLYDNYLKIKAAFDADDRVDADNNGVADVLEVSDGQLVTRKFLLLLRAADPESISKALGGIYAGVIAVAACLHLQFARTVALGVAIGDVLSVPAVKLLVPIIALITPDEYEKWLPVVVRYICKNIGIWIAVTVERILTTVHSAIKGAHLFSIACNVWLQRRGYDQFKGFQYGDEILIALIAVLGIYIQLYFAWELPLLLDILLFPFVLMEKFLFLWLAYSAK